MNMKKLFLFVCLVFSVYASKESNWVIYSLPDTEFDLNEYNDISKLKKVNLRTVKKSKGKTFIFAALVASRSEGYFQILNNSCTLQKVQINEQQVYRDKKGMFHLPLNERKKLISCWITSKGETPELTISSDSITLDKELSNYPKLKCDWDVCNKGEEYLVRGLINYDSDIFVNDMYYGRCESNFSQQLFELNSDVVTLSVKSFFEKKNYDKKVMLKKNNSTITSYTDIFSKVLSKLEKNSVAGKQSQSIKGSVVLQKKKDATPGKLELSKTIVNSDNGEFVTASLVMSSDVAWDLYLNNNKMKSGNSRSISMDISEEIKPGFNEVVIVAGTIRKSTRFYGIRSGDLVTDYSKLVLFSDIVDTIITTPTLDGASFTYQVLNKNLDPVVTETSESSFIWSPAIQLFSGVYYISTVATINDVVVGSSLQPILYTKSGQFPKPVITKIPDERIWKLSPNSYSYTYAVDGLPVTDTFNVGEYRLDGTAYLEACRFGVCAKDSILIPLDSVGLVSIEAPIAGFISASPIMTLSARKMLPGITDLVIKVDGLDKTALFQEANGVLSGTLEVNEGHHTFEVYAKDSYGWDETVRRSFKVKTTPEETDIKVTGKVINGTTMEPVIGASVTISQTRSSVLTTTTGDYVLPTGGFGNFKLTVTHPDYTVAMRLISADSGLHKEIAPIIVMPLNKETVTVQPNVDNTVALQDSSILISATAATSTTPIDISATLYDEIEQLPNEQPGEDVFLFSVDVRTSSAELGDSLTIKVPNKNGLSAGALLPITFFNETTAQWDYVNDGRVTGDGKFIEFKAKKINKTRNGGSSCYHGNCHHYSVKECENQGSTAETNSGACAQSHADSGKSQITYRTGDLGLDYTVSGGAAFTDIGVKLQYWSSTAAPRFRINSKFQNFKLTSSYLGWKLFLPGVSKEWLFYGPSSNAAVCYIWDGKSTSGKTLETGLYTYGLRITDVFMPGKYRYNYAKAENSWVNYSKPTLYKSYYYDFMTFVNREASPYGAGWALAGVTKIVTRKNCLTESFPQTSSFRDINDVKRKMTFMGDKQFSPVNTSTAIGFTKATIAGEHVAIIGAGSYGSIYNKKEGSDLYESPFGTQDKLTKISTGWRRTLENGTIETYDSNGLLIRRENVKGFASVYSYDAFGERLIQITDEKSGAKTTLLYDSYDKLSGIKDQFGRVTQVSIDANNNLVALIDPDGVKARSYEYDANHRAKKKMYPDGAFSQYTFDRFGSITEVKSKDSLVFTYERSVENTIVNDLNPVTTGVFEGFTKKNTSLKVADYSTQEVHKLKPIGTFSYSISNPITGTKQFTYNSFGMLETETDELGNKTTYNYNKNGGFNNPTEIEYSNGLKLIREIDSLGNLIRVTNSETGASTQFAYVTINGVHYVNSITDTLNHVTCFEYDTLGNMIKSTSPSGETMQIIYDELSLPVSITDPKGKVTSFVYDEKGRPSSIIDPLGNETTYEYDRNGNIASIKDPKGRVSSFNYTTAGRLETQTDPAGNVITYTYDDAGRMVALTDPKGNKTTFTFNDKGRVSQIINPLGEARSYHYDIAGRLREFINARGQSIAYSYDKLNRLIQKADISGSPLATFRYDTMNNLVYGATPEYVVNRKYDVAGRLLQEVILPVNDSSSISGATDTITAEDFSRDYTHLVIDNSNVVIDGEHNFLSITLRNNATISHLPTTIDQVHRQIIYARDYIIIDSTSKIDVTGLGYLGGGRDGNTGNLGISDGNSSDQGSSPGSGGSHGGMGIPYSYSGKGTMGVVAITYGNRYWPLQPGGGGGSNGKPGFNGGGVVHLNAPFITINGSILSNGETATAGHGGAGAGGSIIIEADSLQGSGSVKANGGNGGRFGKGTVGCGGGGRIVIKASSLGPVAVHADGGKTGKNGTRVFFGPNGQKIEELLLENSDNVLVIDKNDETFDDHMLVVDNSKVIINGTHSFESITLRNGAVLTHDAPLDSTDVGMVLNVKNSVIIDSTSRIDVSAKGYRGGNKTLCALTKGFMPGSTGKSSGSYGGLGGSVEGSATAVYGSITEPADFGAGGSYQITDTTITAAPLPLKPSKDTILETIGTLLEWKPGSYRHHYSVLLDVNPVPTTVVDDFIENNQLYAVMNMDANTQYYWRVVGHDGVGSSDTSDVFTFKTGDKPYIPRDGLVAYYPFNGNANDESGYDNHGVVNGATLVEDRFGNKNSAYSFDGIDDFIKISDSSYYKSFSISFWFNLNTNEPDETAYLISRRDWSVVSGNSWEIKANQKGIGINFWNQSNSEIGSFYNRNVNISTNNWNHLTITVQAKMVTVYLNSKEVVKGKLDSDYANKNLPLGIGHILGHTERFLKGSVDDLVVYDRMLSEFEISSLNNINNANFNYLKRNTGAGHIKINTTALQNNGRILANGDHARDFNSGAGAGGSILIDAPSVSGKGKIVANGGYSMVNAGGGGGRISFINTTTFNMNAENIQASGGYGEIEGGPGTIYRSDLDSVLISQTDFTETNPITFDDTTITLTENSNIDFRSVTFNNCQVKLEGQHFFFGLSINNSTVEFDSPVLIKGNVELKNNTVLTHSPAVSYKSIALNLDIEGQLSIDSTSSIDVIGKGYSGGYTQDFATVESTVERIGGSHGGIGSSDIIKEYGDYKFPLDYGSGGGSIKEPGGSGGGTIRIKAGGISLQGNIIANSTYSYYGAGAGGSVFVICDSINGHGTISANGDVNEHYCPGGGGRISIFATSISDTIISNIRATGNANGTIYLDINSQDYLIFNGNASTSTKIEMDSKKEVTNLRILNNAKVLFKHDIACKELSLNGNLSVEGNLGSDSIVCSKSILKISGKVSTKNVVLDSSELHVNDTCLVFGKMNLINKSLLTHSEISELMQSSLNIISDEIFIDSSSAINVIGKGYPGGYTKGFTAVPILGEERIGGSHGGKGSGNSGETYGDMSSPIYPGSGGGTSDYNGARGGGAVKVLTSKLTVEGTITADSKYSYPGAGAGGSVWIICDTLLGGGKISANGDVNEHYCPGGGGRISLNSDYVSEEIINNASATGFQNGTVFIANGSDVHIAFKGNSSSAVIVDSLPPTVFKVSVRNGAKVNFNTNLTCNIFDINGEANVSGAVDVKRLVSQNGKLSVGGKLTSTILDINNSTIEVTDSCIVSDSVLICDTSEITHKAFSTVEQFNLMLISNFIKVDSTSSINATGKGYLGGYTVGLDTIISENEDRFGGSHGGKGSGNSIPTYGNYKTPILAGTGGGSVNANGGSGGGVIQLQSNLLELDGSIKADAVYSYYGAGAGGSIYIRSNSITGSGNISAIGDVNEHYCPGGGGRVAIYSDNFDTLQIPVSVTGFEPGTVYYDTIDGYYGGYLRIENSRDTSAHNDTLKTIILPAIGTGVVSSFSDQTITCDTCKFPVFDDSTSILTGYFIEFNPSSIHSKENVYRIIKNNNTTLWLDTTGYGSLIYKIKKNTPFQGIHVLDSIRLKGIKIKSNDPVYFEQIDIEDGEFSDPDQDLHGNNGRKHKFLASAIVDSINVECSIDKDQFSIAKTDTIENSKQKMRKIKILSEVFPLMREKEKKILYNSEQGISFKEVVKLEKELSINSDVKSNIDLKYEFISRFKERHDNFDSIPEPLGTQLVCLDNDPVYTYDILNRRTSMTSPVGTTHYTYDSLSGRLSGITDPQGKVYGFNYALGELTGVTFPNGVASSYLFDDNGNLSSLTYSHGTSPVSSYTYTYDNNGMRTSMTDKSGLHSYGFDNLYQLISATHPTVENPAESFVYDAVGNRLSDTEKLFTNVFDNANRLLEDKQYTYVYDTDGNQVSKTDKVSGAVSSYSYNIENRLVGATVNGNAITYVYGPMGRRLKKTVNGISTEYRFDGLDLIYEINNDGAISASYTFGPGIDWPLSMSRGGANYYYHTDGLGSVTAMTDEVGTVVQEYEYSSFGRIMKQIGTLSNPFTYTSREWDGDIGLYYYRMRFYDPVEGRFISEDPLGFSAGDVNVYRYCWNNVVNYIDPLGLYTSFGNSISTPYSNIYTGGMEKHYRRNALNKPLPTEQDAICAGWKKMAPWKSVFHQLGEGNTTNVKYVSIDGHHEAVYDKNGILVTDPKNMGTYNYKPPSDGWGHFIEDIVPYFDYNNTPKDNTTFQEKIDAIIASHVLKKYLKGTRAFLEYD